MTRTLVLGQEAVFVKGYEARTNQWDIQKLKVESA